MSVTPRFFNSLSGQKEPLQTLEPGKVRLYVCGPTVYDDAHLGHARCYITWDVLVRALRFLGYDVRYARNITDVDDKILARARASGEPFSDLAQRYTQRFHEDMAALNVAPPTEEPRATAFIAEMVAGIHALMAAGCAYRAPDGTVYFRTAAKADYGKLCKQPLDDLRQGARVEVTPDKESPLDFALWKPVDTDDPVGWDTPWGRGRPGWHLECSAMNHALFGAQLDIHAGGADLLFPHHENEIAQSEAWTGHAPFARLWLHNGFVNVSGEKMSKSLGNFATVRTLLTQYDANTIRYFLLTNHYRMPVDFTDDALAGARNRMTKIHRALKLACHTLGLCPETLAEQPIAGPAQGDHAPLLKALQAALCDDLNTPQALAVLDEAITALNRCNQPDTAQPEGLHYDLPAIRAQFLEALAIFTHLGFDASLALASERTAEATFTPAVAQALRTIVHELSGDWLAPDATPAQALARILDYRQRARATKNWAQADAIRHHLEALGIRLMDRKDGTMGWEWGVPSSDQ